MWVTNRPSAETRPNTKEHLNFSTSLKIAIPACGVNKAVLHTEKTPSPMQNFDINRAHFAHQNQFLGELQ
jgi:hypothetical protein